MMKWNDAAWKCHLSLATNSDHYGSTSASPWEWFILKNREDHTVIFLNDETAEMQALVLTEEEESWLMYGATLKAPTERLNFFHGVHVTVT